LTKQATKALSPNTVVSKNERSFSSHASHHGGGLHHSTSNAHMTMVTNDILDTDSEFNFRRAT